MDARIKSAHDDVVGAGVRESPHHGAVESAGGVGQHRGMSQKTSREHSHAMQDEAPKSTTAGTFGRSSIKRLPTELREAVDQAIADGATIDEITARIRAEGEDCSRSAVGRYAKNMRELIRNQQETDRTIKAWAQALGERPEGDVGRILIETLQSMVLATMADLRGRGEPVPMKELDRLSHILKRIESTDKLRKDRERVAEKAAHGRRPRQARGRSLAGGGRHHPRGGRGRSAPAAACSSHRHVGAGGPVESRRVPRSPG